MKRMTWLLTLGLVLSFLVPSIAGARVQAVLGIQAPAEGVQGQALRATLTLADANGRPIAGETITVFESVRFFSYSDQVPIAQVRTNFQGRATVTYTSALRGEAGLVAEFPGSDAYAPATASAPIALAPGNLPPAWTPQQQLLPHVVTPAWVLALLIGVWLAIGISLYHIARITWETGGNFGRSLTLDSSDSHQDPRGDPAGTGES